MKNRMKGFTLTEMLVVLIVIGVLAGLILPAVGKFRIHTLKAATVFEIQQLDSACRQFRQDTGWHPPDMYSVEASYLRRTSPPTLTTGTFLGVLPYSSVFKTYTEGNVGASSPQLKQGVTSKCLVFFLSSKFTVAGKAYGPYYSFDPRQLLSTGETYAGSGSVNVYPTGSSSYRTVQWWVQGIQLREGRVVPLEERATSHPTVTLFKYLDKFGMYKKNDPNNKNYYIYDSYNPYGAWVNYIMHNTWEFDIFSYGLDGLSSLDSVPGTDNQAAIDDLVKVGANRYYYIGCIGDDVNNWGETYKSRRVQLATP